MPVRIRILCVSVREFSKIAIPRSNCLSLSNGSPALLRRDYGSVWNRSADLCPRSGHISMPLAQPSRLAPSGYRTIGGAGPLPGLAPRHCGYAVCHMPLRAMWHWPSAKQ
jgi:hypothetical protein